MYEHCAEFVACSGKYRLVGVDWTSGIPSIVSEHDDIVDAIRQRDFLNKLVSDYFCPIGNMDYQVHDDKGVEQGIAIPPNQWSRDFFLRNAFWHAFMLCVVVLRLLGWKSLRPVPDCKYYLRV